MNQKNCQSFLLVMFLRSSSPVKSIVRLSVNRRRIPHLWFFPLSYFSLSSSGHHICKVCKNHKQIVICPFWLYKYQRCGEMVFFCVNGKLLCTSRNSIFTLVPHHLVSQWLKPKGDTHFITSMECCT